MRPGLHALEDELRLMGIKIYDGSHCKVIMMLQKPKALH
jgi:hypothetical protein